MNHPTPGLPHTADGKPNLAAPVPRTPDGKPDLPGLWDIRVGNGFNIGTESEGGVDAVFTGDGVVYASRLIARASQSRLTRGDGTSLEHDAEA